MTKDIRTTLDVQAALDKHVRECAACTHYCGWCDPVNCDYGPAPRTTDLHAHIADVGEVHGEPECYRAAEQPLQEDDR